MGERYELFAGQKIGKLLLIRPEGGQKWLCKCACGNYTTPCSHNLRTGKTKSCGDCGKNYYHDDDDDDDDGESVEVTATNGEKFYIDKESVPLAKQYKWHITTSSTGLKTVISSDRVYLHRLLMSAGDGVEVDHIDLDRLNNRKKNLRICTHQQNQCNQPLQSNNTSGVSGVSYYPPRSKYRARIKVRQHDIHLGYYRSFLEAVQARNVGMECMFGEYGLYNDVPDAPDWIRKNVTEKCRRFADLSVCEAFAVSGEVC